jgi:two-component system chemotaxis sensor kinase CheA
MSPLLEQFLSEAREFLQGIGQKLMQLEDSPGDPILLNELFRLLHTLKGNSGLFAFPEMTRVLHAGEDLLVQVRTGDIAFTQELADRLLDAMDFVGLLCDEIESGESADTPQAASHASQAVVLAEALRALMPINPAAGDISANPQSYSVGDEAATHDALISSLGSAHQPAGSRTAFVPLAEIPEAVRMEVFRQSQDGEPLHWVAFTPDAGCFFQGDDPFHAARQTPGVKWGRIVAREAFPALVDLDTYHCVLDFHLLSNASPQELAEHYRYVPDQVRIVAIDPLWLIIPFERSSGNSTECVIGGGLSPNTGADEFIADALPLLWAGDVAALKQNAQHLLVLSANDSWLASGLRWLLLLLDCIPDNHRALGLLIESLGSFTPPDWLAGISSRGQGHVGDSDTARILPEPAHSEPLNGSRPLCEQETVVLEQIFSVQRQILELEDRPAWQAGRLKAVARVLTNGFKAAGDVLAGNEVEAALENALADGESTPLLEWLDANKNRLTASSMPGAVSGPVARASTRSDSSTLREAGANADNAGLTDAPSQEHGLAPAPLDDGPKFGRRAEDIASPKSLKVDQVKIDRLMNLIGEMVVAKNALPYLAQRAENQFGNRELAREIKTQYSIINRISDEMQDSIMQVRMMAVSFVFQRFPRLARDISRKLGKKVQLVLEGEETAADKNIIEALADPLIHIVRNSLDHGLETPEVRAASGKPATGTLTIRALQEADRVLIEIIDDGKGIDPALMKRKAYEKGVIDEATLERISDHDAVNLIFAAGFSTAETISDLSGRGVGMDVVRSAVQKVNGTVQVESVVGKGTSVRISLPLSMAVTQVMIVESDGQLFGVPMDHVLETVRIPRSSVHTIKRSQTAVLRDRVVPLKALNTLLGLLAEPKANADDELAVLLVQANGEELGIVVDGFRETMGTIQKPLGGVLSGLSAYSGSALMGDGSVLMVLNVKEIV